jgi:hypothetical protein
MPGLCIAGRPSRRTRLIVNMCGCAGASPLDDLDLDRESRLIVLMAVTRHDL